MKVKFLAVVLVLVMCLTACGVDKGKAPKREEPVKESLAPDVNKASEPAVESSVSEKVESRGDLVFQNDMIQVYDVGYEKDSIESGYNFRLYTDSELPFRVKVKGVEQDGTYFVMYETTDFVTSADTKGVRIHLEGITDIDLSKDSVDCTLVTYSADKQELTSSDFIIGSQDFSGVSIDANVTINGTNVNDMTVEEQQQAALEMFGMILTFVVDDTESYPRPAEKMLTSGKYNIYAGDTVDGLSSSSSSDNVFVVWGAPTNVTIEGGKLILDWDCFGITAYFGVTDDLTDIQLSQVVVK